MQNVNSKDEHLFQSKKLGRHVIRGQSYKKSYKTGPDAVTFMYEIPPFNISIGSLHFRYVFLSKKCFSAPFAIRL